MVRFPAVCRNQVVPINAKLTLPFLRKNVFCFSFQRNINFIGHQGLDFLGIFIPPHPLETPSPKRES